MIIPIYKPYGESTHLLAHRVGKLTDEKATHTGTLDPAAEGVVVVLTGSDRFEKQKFSNLPKKYVAEILLGISTDTHDLIGIPLNEQASQIDIGDADINASLQTLVGSYAQQQPDFSAKRIHGRSYFDLAKEGKVLEKFENSITIHSLDLLSSIKVDIDAVKSHQSSRLQQISGEFRQQEIAQAWHAVSIPSKIPLPIITISVSCSKRTYIRALVRDLSTSLGVPAVLYSLVRTKNGPYSIADCTCLL
jgi:tRNA pseudouridine55 synthase